jgi:SPP1 family predicted phage head-tail adaptor
VNRVRFDTGRANKRLVFQKKTKTADGRGGNTITWTNLAADATVWAVVKPLSSKERYAGDQVQREATHTIEVRYRTDIHSGMRAKLGDRIFAITGVVDVEEAHVKLAISAKEVTPPE